MDVARSRGVAIIHLLNLTDYPRKVKQGTEIAVCQMVQNVTLSPVQQPLPLCLATYLYEWSVMFNA